MTQNEIIERTREWLHENFMYVRPDWTLGVDDPMLDMGVIDSIGVIELVEFLGDAFGVDVAADELTERNLGSLRAVGQFVYRKYHANGNGKPTRPRRPA